FRSFCIVPHKTPERRSARACKRAGYSKSLQRKIDASSSLLVRAQLARKRNITPDIRLTALPLTEREYDNTIIRYYNIEKAASLDHSKAAMKFRASGSTGN